MSKTFKPMLAGEADLSLMDFGSVPFYVSLKLDGIRCVIKDGVALSRTLKPIPNKYIASLLNDPLLDGLDGELVVGDINDPKTFRKTTNGVMSVEGEPDFTFWVYDDFTDTTKHYMNRHRSALYRIARLPEHLTGKIMVLPAKLVVSRDMFDAFEEDVSSKGLEGVILRRNDRGYKFGRSSMGKSQQHLLKYKRVTTEEARIVGYHPLMSNENEATINELGNTERSLAKDGMVEKPLLGALEVVDLKTGVQFKVGSGFNQEDRENLWLARENLIGKIISYNFFSFGDYDKPKNPIYNGFRHEDDIL